MPDLITVRHHDGYLRTCDEKCYDATGDHCVCICGGRNHGVGYNKAVMNSARLYLLPDLLEDKDRAHPGPRKLTADKAVHDHLHDNFYPKPPPP